MIISKAIGSPTTPWGGTVTDDEKGAFVIFNGGMRVGVTTNLSLSFSEFGNWCSCGCLYLLFKITNN